MGLTLTLFDISLFPLSCAVQSNPVWLYNRESWRTFFATISDRWIAHKQDFVVYLTKQFPFPLARVQLIFHTRGCCWWLQSEFNIHLPTISRACHFGAGALFHALIHAAISSSWHTHSDLWQSRGTEWLPIKCTWACLYRKIENAETRSWATDTVIESRCAYKCNLQLKVAYRDWDDKVWFACKLFSFSASLECLNFV